MAAMKNFIINVADFITEIVGANTFDAFDFCAVMGHESDFYEDRDTALFSSVMDGLVGHSDSFNLLLVQLFDSSLYNREYINSMISKSFPSSFERSYFMYIVIGAAKSLLENDPEEYGDSIFYPHIAELIAS